tara:strand:- start:74632 stop:74880 length:249 start_codon:yes stop_codon:yes gene_type:complete
MALTIRYFAALRDAMGRSEETLPFEAGETGEGLTARIAAADGRASALLHPSTRLIVNDEIAPRALSLQDGDTIAFCPPFSGG